MINPRSGMIGILERRFGKWVAWCKEGYISHHGIHTKKISNARLFDGSGEAIRMAQVYGFAIIEWPSTGGRII